VSVERLGRGLSTVSARLHQDGRDCVLALAALGVDRPGPSFDDQRFPDVPAPDAVPRPPAGSGIAIPFRDRFDTRPAIGGNPFVAGSQALTGGWIRTVDDDPVDEVVVAALTDAWPPAVFSRVEVPVGVPTIDLTIHFRQPPSGEPGWSLVRFTTKLAEAGYLEEDGEVWSADGRLLAQSRQLAVVLAPG
jgi:acyl-CoA thioesterase